MKRRTFDLLVSIGGLVLAGALVVSAMVFHGNAEFAKDSVRDQLTAQKVFFPPRDALSAEELDQPGVVKYAGQQVVNGDQAEVYANQFIALHLRDSLGGQTYSQLSTKSRQSPEDAKLTAQVLTAFRGETLRGLLLTSFAFWTLGQKADQVALVFIVGAALLLVLALFGVWHYSRTPKREQLNL
jgi:hypothetical protein